MSASEKTSVIRMILQAVEDFATVVKGEIEIAKKSLTTSVKKISLGIGFVITAFLLLNVSLLFLLIALAYGFIQIGLAGWLSFLLVAGIMILLSLIFILVAIQIFWKVKKIGYAAIVSRRPKK
jgi:hypothetical protein